jgi:hypothetical protein
LVDEALNGGALVLNIQFEPGLFCFASPSLLRWQGGLGIKQASSPMATGASSY